MLTMQAGTVRQLCAISMISAFVWRFACDISCHLIESNTVAAPNVANRAAATIETKFCKWLLNLLLFSGGAAVKMLNAEGKLLFANE